jgi:predicted aspartyl protease
LLCAAEVIGPLGRRRRSLLLDTGSNYSVLPTETLEAIGCSPATSPDHVRITTADGVLIAPRVRVQALTVFDRRFEGAAIVAHDLPFAGPIDGLLGMDLLTALDARIDIPAGEIEIS